MTRIEIVTQLMSGMDREMWITHCMDSAGKGMTTNEYIVGEYYKLADEIIKQNNRFKHKPDQYPKVC